MSFTLLYYLTIGAFAGLLSGLLGVGGGLVIVPALLFLFQVQGFSSLHLMHLAVATSLATIVVTAAVSALAHHRRGAVDWSLVTRLIPGVLLGAFFGAWLAHRLPSEVMQRIFALFMLYVALRMILQLNPTAVGGRTITAREILFLPGIVIGMISTLVGIGGGSLTVPYLLYRHQAMLRAVATSSACGVPIALAGSAGFILLGGQAGQLPSRSLGYIYYPAFFGIIAASVFFAPLGAHLARRMPTAYLKRLFATFLLLVGIRMLFSVS
ncbi:MAG TPA: hypothetical protein DCZ03_16190 [Gammaproteobacteria bacterium]|nr:hypothetical protein [Gammaproteobacteria bacterium]